MADSVSRHLFLLVFFFFSSTFTSATDHIVGDNRGWNQGINYTLWANNHTFYVNDEISFRYQKNQYNVYQVNQSGYDNCTTDGAYGNWSSGKDFITFTKAKWYYFICGNYACNNGMKVAVLVHALPPPPTAAEAANQKSGGGEGFRRGPAVWRAVLGSMAVFLGWALVGSSAI